MPPLRPGDCAQHNASAGRWVCISLREFYVLPLRPGDCAQHNASAGRWMCLSLREFYVLPLRPGTARSTTPVPAGGCVLACVSYTCRRCGRGTARSTTPVPAGGRVLPCDGWRRCRCVPSCMALCILLRWAGWRRIAGRWNPLEQWGVSCIVVPRYAAYAPEALHRPLPQDRASCDLPIAARNATHPMPVSLLPSMKASTTLCRLHPAYAFGRPINWTKWYGLHCCAYRLCLVNLIPLLTPTPQAGRVAPGRGGALRRRPRARRGTCLDVADTRGSTARCCCCGGGGGGSGGGFGGCRQRGQSRRRG